MKALSHDDNPKFTRMVKRDALILLAINMVIGLVIVVVLWLAAKYDF